MRILVTGASGYIGQVLCELAIKDGHKVVGLSRNQNSHQVLEQLGVAPVLGDLRNWNLLEDEAAKADAVLHLAFIHDWKADFDDVLAVDKRSVEALVAGLANSDKPLVIASGSGVVEPDPAGGETNESSPASDNFVLKDRIRAERFTLSLAAENKVRISAIRLPMYVYGRGGGMFLPLLMRAASERGVSAYVADGTKQVSTVHVEDAVRCFLLAAERAPSGSVFNCANEAGVTTRQLAEAIGSALELPVKSLPRTEVEELLGPFLTAMIDYQNRPSSARARRELGWSPEVKTGILEDITAGSYRELSAALRTKAAHA